MKFMSNFFLWICNVWLYHCKWHTDTDFCGLKLCPSLTFCIVKLQALHTAKNLWDCVNMQFSSTLYPSLLKVWDVWWYFPPITCFLFLHLLVDIHVLKKIKKKIFLSPQAIWLFWKAVLSEQLIKLLLLLVFVLYCFCFLVVLKIKPRDLHMQGNP